MAKARKPTPVFLTAKPWFLSIVPMLEHEGIILA